MQMHRTQKKNQTMQKTLIQISFSPKGSMHTTYICMYDHACTNIFCVETRRKPLVSPHDSQSSCNQASDIEHP